MFDGDETLSVSLDMPSGGCGPMPLARERGVEIVQVELLADRGPAVRLPIVARFREVAWGFEPVSDHSAARICSTKDPTCGQGMVAQAGLDTGSHTADSPTGQSEGWRWA